jgi:hypothetical protein
VKVAMMFMNSPVIDGGVSSGFIHPYECHSQAVTTSRKTSHDLLQRVSPRLCCDCGTLPVLARLDTTSGQGGCPTLVDGALRRISDDHRSSYDRADDR